MIILENLEIVLTHDTKFPSKTYRSNPKKNWFYFNGNSPGMSLKCSRTCKRYGGEHIKGLEMFDSGIPKGVYLNPHSIWKTPEGKFVDVTPLEVVGGDEGETEPRPQPYLFIPLLRVSENLWIDLQITTS